ncbi:ATP-dependent RecD-like DNA helicase [invertebrate metagenome]|uniref:ATP-dependent RecD-like DNA helicase n=1 Tax=invertebrate metagenome TaxID=1711999 RepID=A0A2H9T4X5_9ZZZZ
MKKKARLDPLFLQAEAKADVSRKRQLRLNKNFLENERLKQVERRKQNTIEHNTLDRIRKADNRKHDSFSGNERHQYKKRRFGNDIAECITVFQRKIQRGPEYVCTCCQQTWFSESVKESCPIPVFPQYTDFYTGFKSVDGKEWICHTCYASLKKCKVPKLSVKNGMKWPEKPPELDLHPLEERLVALRIPFMQIRELPRGGQYSVKGNVVNVPIDIQPTINALPRQMDEHFTVAVKLKKRLTYKSCVLSENVRPNMVLSALHWLMNNSDLYKNSCIKIDDDWVQKTAESAEEIVQEFTKAQDNESNVLKNQSSSIPTDQFKIRHFKENNSDNKSYDDSSNACEKDDNFIEMNEDECVQGNSDTLIDEANLDTNKELVFAPGEGQRPIGLYHDENAEVLSFPSIYCAQKRLENNERQTPVSYSDLAKWELRSVDRRAAASVPNIFFKLNKIQRKQVADKVNLAIRRKKSDGNKITASDAQNPEIADKIVSLNEGYYIFRTLRNSPAYLSSRKKDVFAMIRQIGLPTWFMSLSSADTRWNELLKTLAVLSGTPCSDQQIRNMTWSEKVKLVQKDPVTCSRYFDHRVQVFMNTVLKSEHAPIGSVTDTFQRIEFQNRGSPHVHMMIWTENAPKYNIDSEEDIIRYVDKYVTCSLDVDDDMQEFIKMQVHKHSKTCKKGGRSVCRFGFPLPPLPNTMLLEPLETDVDEYRQKYSEIHARMNEFKDGCDMSYEEFLTEVVQIEEAEYIKCIRSSLKGPKIFLKREPKEMRVNYYNTTVLQAWKANLDLQFVLDPYACAMYIVSYISKSQRGMSTMLEQASKEAAEGNMDLKRQVRHIGNKFLNFVEISAQEASYLVLQMPLTRASREVVFINTSLPKDRVFLLKSQEQLKDLPKNSTDIESDNIIKRYARRPKKLENYCLADYVSELDVKYKKPKQSLENDHNDDDDTGHHSDEDDHSESESDTEFNNENTIMKLRGGITIRKRKNPRIIRYVRYSKTTNAENHYREKLLLFVPWRNEEQDLLSGHESYEEHFNSRQQQILPIIDKYEHHVEELDMARHQAEEDIVSEFDTVAPNTEQVQAEDAEQSVDRSEEFIHYVPPEPSHRTVDIGQDLNLPESTVSVETRSVLLPDNEYMTLLRSLNKKQREFFNHVVKWISTKNEPIYAFLSGGAGVGKSVVIRALFQALQRQLNSKEGHDPDSIKILLTAFTGKAAYNINGVTIASAFHKKMFQTQQHMHSDELNTFRTTYKDLSVIIVDEISMVGNKLFAFMHERLTELTGTKRDFGGISIIAVGDLFQLSPVADSWIFNDLKIGLARNLWKEHFQLFELEEIMRQKDDLQFAQMLNRLRLNELLPEDRDLIKSHTITPASPTYPKNALHLFTENKRVDYFNSELIQDLVTTKVNVPAHTDVIAPSNISKQSKLHLIKEMNKQENHSKTGNLPSLLKLAEEMLYDVTVNVDVKDGLTNGASGIVKHIEFKEMNHERPGIIWILFTDENIGSKRRTKYKDLYHRGINRLWTPMFETKRTFLNNRKTYERTQFPLAPSAAKTVHKAQGTTVDELVVDLRSNYKAPHIHYVALSRVRTFSNLYILDFNDKALTVDKNVHVEMDRLRKIPMHLCYIPLYNIDNAHVKLLFNNARSLHKHIDDVRREPNIQSADIIGICESRLVDTDRQECYDLPGFTAHRLDEDHNGTTRPNHGLVVYVKHGITVDRVHPHRYDGIESMTIHAKVKETEIQVVYLYKTPKLGMQSFLKALTDHIKPCIDRNRSLFILGDFNINLLDISDAFLRFMRSEFSCKQVITEPTTCYGTLLDHIYTTETGVQTGVIPTYWSDHSLTFCMKQF